MGGGFRNGLKLPNPECSKGCSQWDGCLLWKTYGALSCPCKECLIKAACRTQCSKRASLYDKYNT